VITGSRGEAEDLAQEAFTRLFERWDRVAALDDPTGYLHRTATNLFRNQIDLGLGGHEPVRPWAGRATGDHGVTRSGGFDPRGRPGRDRPLLGE
jgi:hypothetical protein